MSIGERVEKITAKTLGRDPAMVRQTSNFSLYLGADSLDTVELIMQFEKEFNIQIPDDQAENIATVGQAISYIENILTIKFSWF